MSSTFFRNSRFRIEIEIAIVSVAVVLSACQTSPESDINGTATGGSVGQSGFGGAGGGTMGQGGAGAQPSGGAGGTGGTSGTGGAAGTGGTGTGNPLVPGSSMECGSETFVVPRHIEAECAFGPNVGNCDGISGGQRGVRLENANTTAGFIEGGDSLWFDGVAFDKLDTLTIRYAKGEPGGNVDVRLDSESGPLLARLTPPVTAGWTSWHELTVPLEPTTGTHAVYLAATGATGGILNLDWIRLSARQPSGGVSAIRLNHVGFDTLGPKHAVVEGSSSLVRFSVVQSDGKAVWCGALSAQAFTAWGSTASFYSVDFTGLTAPGTYRLVVDGTASEPFPIADRRLFAETFPSVLEYFNASRANDGDVWAADAAVPFFGGGGTIDARGGWYDASGDISKYLSHLSYANYLNPQQIPLVAWALAWVVDARGAALAETGLTDATRAEALWGADYLVRVLDPAGFFYTNVFDQWSGAMSDRQICAFEQEAGIRTTDWQSALREGGGMSVAALARIARWEANGGFPAARYLAAARTAFTHLNERGFQYADDGRENIIDDYTGLLAASELFAATDETTYLEAARARAASLIGRLTPSGMFVADGASRPFWHASDAGLPVVALVRYTEVETNDSERQAALAAVRSHLEYLLSVTSEVPNPFGYSRQLTGSGSAFFIPHVNESGYWWQGENARLGSLAAAAILGADATGAGGEQYLAFLRYAGHQLDWILGKNPRTYAFCTASEGTTLPHTAAANHSTAPSLAAYPTASPVAKPTAAEFNG